MKHSVAVTFWIAFTVVLVTAAWLMRYSVAECGAPGARYTYCYVLDRWTGEIHRR